MNGKKKTKKQSEMVGTKRTSYPLNGYGVFLQGDRIFYFLVFGSVLFSNLLTI